jgi:uncharacterized protein
MSERDSYEHGVPCWVDHSSKEPERAAEFYSALFGWETQDTMPPGSDMHYLVASLNGRPVAALGSQQMDEAPPLWNTYIAVDSADEAIERATASGGSVMGEAYDIFDAGRMGVLQDQAGTWICVWQAKDMAGAGVVNEPGSFCWNELTTRDVEGSKAFYRDVFGWEMKEISRGDDGRYFTLHRAGQTEEGSELGGLMPMEGDMWPDDLPNHWMVYFAVEDTDAAIARCEELGGKVAVPPFDVPVGRMAVLNDPLGSVFSVIALHEAR